MTSQNYYNIAGFFAVVFWSMTVAVGRSLSEALGPLTAATAIYLLAGILGSVPHIFNYLFRKRSLKVASKTCLLVCSILFTTYMTTLFLALGKAHTRDGVIVVGLINYLWIPFTIIFSRVINRQSISRKLAFGVVIASCGVALSLSNGATLHNFASTDIFEHNINAYLLAFTAAISWALYSVFTNQWGKHNSDAVPLFMLSTGVFLFFLKYFSSETPRWTLPVLIELVVMAIVTSLGYILWDLSMRKGQIRVIVPFSYVTPLLSTILSIFYLNIEPTLTFLAGSILVISGAYACYIFSKDI